MKNKKILSILFSLIVLSGCNGATTSATSNSLDSQNESSINVSDSVSSETSSSSVLNEGEIDAYFQQEDYVKTMMWPEAAIGEFIASRYQEFAVPLSTVENSFYYKVVDGNFNIYSNQQVYDESFIDSLESLGYTVIEMVNDEGGSTIIAALDTEFDIYITMELVELSSNLPVMLFYNFEVVFNFDGVDYSEFYESYEKHDTWPEQTIHAYLESQGVTENPLPEFSDENNGFYTKEVVLGDFIDLQIVIDTKHYPHNYLDILRENKWSVDDYSIYGVFYGYATSPDKKIKIEYSLTQPSVTTIVPVPENVVITIMVKP